MTDLVSIAIYTVIAVVCLIVSVMAVCRALKCLSVSSRYNPDMDCIEVKIRLRRFIESSIR